MTGKKFFLKGWPDSKSKTYAAKKSFAFMDRKICGGQNLCQVKATGRRDSFG